ncbi:N-glycosylase/DNA lyase [Saccharolobus caldissimus]|uniref:8-oxoguanine DNA glycosylase/AP lyase n=1 Tax=Saccharolobus caldissimus TaxID=1702097 RepID=A0AAQ4CPP6_9CREN|nr:N-glycosylase/DNA lyase [Saccharolobus caldissimus]BDB97777.1 DNA lyase [Saccharolobus caldissimus]
MLRNLILNQKLRAKVLERIEEFKLNNSANEEVWFRELVLCILTANSSFLSAFKALNCLGELIYYADETIISKNLRSCNYRFYNLKAKYIVEARKMIYGKLKDKIKPIADQDPFLAREKLLKIKGLGMKESSHFLRNVGYFDLAIIDRHVINFLKEIGALGEKRIRSLSKSQYIVLENILKSIASNFNIKVGVFDLFIWYKETNTIVK